MGELWKSSHCFFKFILFTGRWMDSLNEKDRNNHTLTDTLWSIKYTIIPIVSFNTVKRDEQWHTDKETIRPPHINRNWLMGWMIHISMCLFVLPADELVGMSYFHKCLLFCSWGPQGVGLCQTDLPLSRGMGSFSGGSLSMADTPTVYIYDSDWYASYQNSLLFLILFTGISGDIPS